MNYQDYISQKKDLYDFVLKYITNTDETAYTYQDLENYFKTKNNVNSKDELQGLLHLLVKVSKNHSRTQELITKIEQIIEFFTDKIKQTFTNSYIFNIFKSSQLLVLYLIDKKILILDKSLIIQILEKSAKTSNYCLFFSPEIKSFIKTEKIKNFDTELSQLEQFDDSNFEVFDSNRRTGENSASICSLIRNDSIEEFTSLISKSNISMSRTRIRSSLFETNSIFINVDPLLIEYAAFFGSIKIFQYLVSHKAVLTLPVLICAVHSNSIELIQLLEDHIKGIPVNNIIKCYLESIKCHHNEIAKYIKEHFMNTDEISNLYDKKIDREVLSYAYRFYNYEFLPTELSSKLNFYLACQFGYLEIVKILTHTKKINVNEPIVFFIDFFLYDVHKFYISNKIHIKIFFNDISKKKNFFNKISI